AIAAFPSWSSTASRAGSPKRATSPAWSTAWRGSSVTRPWPNASPPQRASGSPPSTTSSGSTTDWKRCSPRSPTAVGSARRRSPNPGRPCGRARPWPTIPSGQGAPHVARAGNPPPATTDWSQPTVGPGIGYWHEISWHRSILGAVLCRDKGRRMMHAERTAMLEKLRRQAALCAASRSVRLRHLPFHLVLPRMLNAAGLPRCVTARTFFGHDLRVHLPDLVGVKLYQYGFFEEGLTRAIIEKLPRGGVFIDIGAHVGYFTALAS